MCSCFYISFYYALTTKSIAQKRYPKMERWCSLCIVQKKSEPLCICTPSRTAALYSGVGSIEKNNSYTMHSFPFALGVISIHLRFLHNDNFSSISACTTTACYSNKKSLSLSCNRLAEKLEAKFRLSVYRKLPTVHLTFSLHQTFPGMVISFVAPGGWPITKLNPAIKHPALPSANVQRHRYHRRAGASLHATGRTEPSKIRAIERAGLKITHTHKRRKKAVPQPNQGELPPAILLGSEHNEALSILAHRN